MLRLVNTDVYIKYSILWSDITHLSQNSKKHSRKIRIILLVRLQSYKSTSKLRRVCIWKTIKMRQNTSLPEKHELKCCITESVKNWCLKNRNTNCSVYNWRLFAILFRTTVFVCRAIMAKETKDHCRQPSYTILVCSPKPAQLAKCAAHLVNCCAVGQLPHG